MYYHVYIETAATGPCMAHILDLPGCFARAKKRAELDFKLLQAIREYQDWLEKHAESGCSQKESISFDIIEEQTGIGPFNPGDAAALFAPEREPLTLAEMKRYFHLMEYSRVDLFEVIKKITEEMLDYKPTEQAFTFRQILRHIGNAEEWYVSRLVPPETLPKEWEHDENLPIVRFLKMERRTALNRLRRLTDEERSTVVYPHHWTQHPDEAWAARKVLRRFLEHEREHTRQICDNLAQQLHEKTGQHHRQD